jgi:DNA-binding response OmpR family regulator
VSTRVLIADDSETILLLLRTRLEMEGYEVVTAADGVEVIELMGRGAEPPDILLLDAMMPRKSGIDIPVLIVSAHQDEMDAGAATDVEVSGYITKPIDFEKLFSRIAELTA